MKEVIGIDYERKAKPWDALNVIVLCYQGYLRHKVQQMLKQ